MTTENPSALVRGRSDHPSARVIDLSSEADLRLPGSQQPVRVLVVEPDPLFATLVANILEQAGSNFIVDHASTLGAAMPRLARDPIDLILTEVDLPDSAGPTTVGALRAFAPRIPIVVLSDNDHVQSAVEAIRQGADEYIVKGRFSIDSLLWLVRLVLERHRRWAAEPMTDLTDPVTGLATLAALQMAGQRCLLMAERAGFQAGIAFLEINAAPRREPADREQLLLTVGDLLQATLRRCDLVSRLPGGHLAALLVSDRPLGGAVERLTAALADAGVGPHVRVGFAAYDSRDGATVDALLEQARSNAQAVLT